MYGSIAVDALRSVNGHEVLVSEIRDLENEIGKGTRFTILLPINEPCEQLRNWRVQRNPPDVG